MEVFVSEKIRRLRKSNKLTQEQLAEKLDISRSKVSSWERRKRSMTVTDAIKIAKLFHISLDNFFEIKEITEEDYIEISDRFFKSKKIDLKEKTKVVNIINKNFKYGNIDEIYNKMTQSDSI